MTTYYLRFEFRQRLHKSELQEWEPEELVDLGLLEIHVVEDEPGQLLHPVNQQTNVRPNLASY